MKLRAVLLALLVVLAGVLWWFPPERYTFYPRCPVYEAFGWLCPGCGATRAAAALLHGHMQEALHWNALFVAGLGLGLMWWAMRWTHPPAWLTRAAWMLTVVFTVGRNLVR